MDVSTLTGMQRRMPASLQRLIGARGTRRGMQGGVPQSNRISVGCRNSTRASSATVPRCKRSRTTRSRYGRNWRTTSPQVVPTSLIVAMKCCAVSASLLKCSRHKRQIARLLQSRMSIARVRNSAIRSIRTATSDASSFPPATARDSVRGRLLNSITNTVGRSIATRASLLACNRLRRFRCQSSVAASPDRRGVSRYGWRSRRAPGCPPRTQHRLRSR